MPKRSRHDTTLEFTAKLLRQLDERRPTSATDLAHSVRDVADSISPAAALRKVQRHLTQMAAAGLVDIDRSSKPFSVRLRAVEHTFPPAQMTPQEALMLRMAWSQMQHLMPPATRQALDALFERARDVLGSTPGLQRSWLNKVATVASSLPLLPPRVERGLWDVVCQALYEDRDLEVDYCPPRGETRTRRARPLALVQQGQTLYLVARLERDGSFEEQAKHLALHRMRAARLPKLPPFQRDDSFDLERHLANHAFGYGDGQALPLEFDIEIDAGWHLFETPLTADQQIEDLGNGWLRVRATTVSSLWTWNWLRSFGSRLELRQPKLPRAVWQSQAIPDLF